MTAEEWRTRCDLAAAYRLIADYGWDDIVFTHLSARVPGRDEHFLLNPYGFAFDEITAESLVKVDLDGVPVERTEYGVNPAGFTIHSAVHGARDDAGAVMHLHTDAGVAVSAMSRGLMPLSQHCGGLPGTRALRDGSRAARRCERRRAAGTRSRGARARARARSGRCAIQSARKAIRLNRSKAPKPLTTQRQNEGVLP